MEILIGIIFIVFVLVRTLLGKDDDYDGPKGPPWTRDLK